MVRKSRIAKWTKPPTNITITIPSILAFNISSNHKVNEIMSNSIDFQNALNPR